MSTLNTVSELKDRDIVVASPPQLELPSAAYVALTFLGGNLSGVTLILELNELLSNVKILEQAIPH